MTSREKNNLLSILRLMLIIPGSFAALFLAGCHTDMWVQNKVNRPLAESDFFPDGSSARPLVPHSVARGHFHEDDTLYTGILHGTRVNVSIGGESPVETGIFRGQYVSSFPFAVTRDVMNRGQSQYNIFCAPCHGILGDGQGMIALRGFNIRKRPANYHTERLRKMPAGHFYDVITNGYGVMYSYAERIQDPHDRWAIVAYIRALQYSRHAGISDVPSADIQKLMNQPQPEPKEATTPGVNTGEAQVVR